MDHIKSTIPLQPENIELLKRCRAAFCDVLQGKFDCMAQIQNVEDHAASSFTNRKAAILSEIVYRKQLSKNLKISVWKDDLTTHKVDAVVNAANEKLSHGAGLALALSQAGGPEIQQWSNEIIRDRHEVPTGTVVMTPAGKLPCKNIIHAVGPCVSPYANNIELNKASALLEQTIWSILQKADYERLRSVAIPAISSGLYNFPLTQCAKIIVTTIKSFSEKRSSRAPNLEVQLVNNDDPSVEQMHRACKELLGTSHLKSMRNQSNVPTQPSFPSLDLGNVALHLKKGAIEDETTDVIVNTISNNLDLSKGMVSAALLKKAGRKIQEEIRRSRHFASEGDVIPTGGYALKCRAVFHTVCVSATGHGSNQILFPVVLECLQKASSGNYSSISFPALGTGNLGYEKDEVCKIMIRAVKKFSENYGGVKMNVYFVIFPKDTDTLKAFESQMVSTKIWSSDINARDAGRQDPTPVIELFAPCVEALREAQRWLSDILYSHCDHLEIHNNHVVHLSQEDHEKLMFIQIQHNVSITEFFHDGKGGIIINGDNVDTRCAAVEVEAMLCRAQEDFAKREEMDMQANLDQLQVAEHFGQQEPNEMMSNRLYQKIPIDIKMAEGELKKTVKNLEKCGMIVVKVEKIENRALKTIFQLKSGRIQKKPQRLYQRVNTQFHDVICRVGFQREYAPPEEQKCGAGIYFTNDVKKAESLWKDSEEEYLYFVEALVLTGNEATASPELIVPPLIGSDPLDRYDSVSDRSGIHVIFNGHQAYPEFLITCKRQLKSQV